MATISLRSSKRNEGLNTRSSRRNGIVHSGNNDSIHSTQQLSNIGRKRPRVPDSIDNDEQALKHKKAKLAVEIIARPKAHALPKRSLVTKVNAKDVPPPQRSEPPPTTNTLPRAPSPPRKPHHEKVVQGIKHELDRLQPIAADLNKDEKRKLRSQEGTRFKSDLSAYFPEYDEVIGNEPKEDHILNFDTPIIIVDSTKASAKQARKTNGEAHDYDLKDFPDSLFEDLHDSQRVDFSFLETHWRNGEEADPLSDEYFESIHRKPERQEKSIRNTDKGRAQHEKDQVTRLLEGLQGHDWLKLMGVSGITDSKKKDYEPARIYFIKGCEAILEKFRTWRDEEKRRKLAKELAIAEAETQEAEDDEDDEGNVSDGDPPDYSDVDASAARQLHEEAIARSAPVHAPRSERRPKVEPIALPVHELEKDFVSFFPKPYLREAALGRTRRSGRSVAAWGHPVPEVSETDFDLPEECKEPEFLKAHARGKRRVRRVSKD